MNIKSKFIQKALIERGYVIHRDGIFAGGYVRWVDKPGKGRHRYQDRFHAKYVSDDKFAFHYDYTNREGKHVVRPERDKHKLRNEHNEILLIIARMTKEERDASTVPEDKPRRLSSRKARKYAKQEREIEEAHAKKPSHKIVITNIERHKFNPMRYIRGKFKAKVKKIKT